MTKTDEEAVIPAELPGHDRSFLLWLGAAIGAEALLVFDWIRVYLEQAASVQAPSPLSWGQASILGSLLCSGLGGLLLGFAAWPLLRPYGSARWRWLGATVSGWVLAGAVSSVARPIGLNYPEDWQVLPLCLLGGLLLGLLQWLSVRRWIDWGAELWILVAAGSWLVIWLVPFLIRLLPDPIPPPAAPPSGTYPVLPPSPSWTPHFPDVLPVIVYAGCMLLLFGIWSGATSGIISAKVLRVLLDSGDATSGLARSQRPIARLLSMRLLLLLLTGLLTGLGFMLWQGAHLTGWLWHTL